jgi:hypothetical protein
MRAWAIALLVVLFAGSTLLDRCLIACHDDGPDTAAASEPSCHQAAAPATTDRSLRGSSHCDHDHDGLVADAAVDARAVHAAHVDAPLALVSNVRLHAPGLPFDTLHLRGRPRPRHAPSATVQLRV